MNELNNKIDGETLVQYLSKVQFNAAKWAYMKLHGAMGEEEAAAKLFADRQLKAAKIEALLAEQVRLEMSKFGLEKGVKYDVKKSDKVIVITPTTDTTLLEGKK